jgi:hypothetical protein
LTKTKAEQITADQLLGIPQAEPERLFSQCNKDQVKKEYRQLAMLWHSDHNKDPRATNVMQRITELYDKANDKIDQGKWEIPNTLIFETADGKKKKLSYLKKVPFELGQMYIADASVTFVVDKSERALYDNAKSIISGFKYPDDKMRPKLQRVLPQIKHHFETPDKLIMVVNKDPDEILLADILRHEKGKIDPKHAAWIISRLHNISCYLEWAGLTHNAMSIDTCFISPKDHRVNLLGGWWYACKEGAKLKALPPRTVAVAPPTLLDKPIATKSTDMTLVRAVGREILGDATGRTLIGSKDIPKKIISWVNGASSGDAQEDFRVWSKEILTSSFGARRFVEMKIAPNDIYQPA